MTETAVALALFFHWLNEQHSRRFRLESTDGDDALAVERARGGKGTRLAIAVRPLLEPTENAAWLAQRERLEAAIAEGLPATVTRPGLVRCLYCRWLPRVATSRRVGIAHAT